MKKIIFASVLFFLMLSCNNTTEKSSKKDVVVNGLNEKKITDKTTTKQDFTLGSSHLVFANFLPQEWIDQVAKVSYPSVFENTEIDNIEVKVNEFKPPNWEHDIAISHLRLYHGDTFENLFVLNLPDENGNLSEENRYVQNIESYPCKACYLVDISTKGNEVIGSFAMNREMTKFERRILEYNLEEGSIFWGKVLSGGKTSEVEATFETSDVPNAKSFQLCTSEEASDCYIKGLFDKDGDVYINVDFIAYEIISETAGTDSEEYKIINNNPKIRTFRVKDSYLKCTRTEFVFIQDLVNQAKAAPTTIFSLEAKDGLVDELYIDTCSG